MTLLQTLQGAVIASLSSLYNQDFTVKDFQVSLTKPEFEGDYTIVLFSLVKSLKRSPEILGKELGAHIIKHHSSLFYKYNIIKGFLNITVTDKYFFDLLKKNYTNKCFGKKEVNGKRIMVEYSSPNTNKPLHLGHLRNNFIGWSISEILKSNGFDVIKSCIVNDRGIHICKSMLAWKLYANGATPESTHTKGDHFVGDYYVKFNDEYKKQVAGLMASGRSKEEAEKEAPLMKATQQMLLDWENNDPEVKSLWKTMNAWVYEGFDITYHRIGSDFDKMYYESETYLLGKDFVQEGLEKGILYKKENGSIWIDLTDSGLDEKLVLRSDGTSVYITSDIGLAKQKYEQYKPDQSIYVVGDEQIYHIKVLKLICQKLGMPFADGIYHLSYGMVELPSGKMKSREGTVVDADDLIEEMIATAKTHTEELGKVKDFNEEELKDLYETLGLGAMKFYLLRVDPKKRMIFNPEESIDFHGFTGPFIQYTFARIQSVLRKANSEKAAVDRLQLTVDSNNKTDNSQLTTDNQTAVDRLQLTVDSNNKTDNSQLTTDNQTAVDSLQFTVDSNNTTDNSQLTTDNQAAVDSLQLTVDSNNKTDNSQLTTNNQTAVDSLQLTVDSNNKTDNSQLTTNNQLLPLEKELLIILEQYPTAIEQVAEELNPSVIASYVFNLAQTFNSFYTEHSIVNAETESKKNLRLYIAIMTSNVLESGMQLLGISMPQKM